MIKKRRKSKILNARRVECDIIKQCAAFANILCFSPKKVKNNHFIKKWPDHLLLVTSYPVAIAIDSHQPCVKMCLRDMHAASENDRCR